METEKENQTADDCPYHSVIFRLGWRIHRYLDKKYFFWVIKKYFRKMESLNRQLVRSRRVDLVPTKDKGRGFMLILNNREALKFTQEDDHFIYDGCLIDDYENGDVTIFDHLEK